MRTILLNTNKKIELNPCDLNVIVASLVMNDGCLGPLIKIPFSNLISITDNEHGTGFYLKTTDAGKVYCIWDFIFMGDFHKWCMKNKIIIRRSINKDINIELANWRQVVKKVMTNDKISQVNLSNAVCLSRSYISEILSGKKEPVLSTFVDIMLALDLNPKISFKTL